MIKLYTRADNGGLTYIGSEINPVKLAKKYKLDLSKINNVLAAIEIGHKYEMALVPGTCYAVQEVL